MSLRAIAEAANDLAELLEKSAPKGLLHPRHAVHIKPARAAIKRVMVHFFERQRKAVLAAVKPHIERELLLHPRTNKESFRVAEASQGGKTFARALIPTSLHPLSFSPTAGETSEYNEAITDLIGAAAKSLGTTAGPDFAGDYLAKNSLSKLTGGLNSTSIERLQDALATSWDAGGDYDSMVKAITDTFDDFTTTRAELIAQTEANDAYSDARQQIAVEAGLDEKRWDPDGDACPECQANADQGWIDIEDSFDSGDDAPTSHPGCDCGCDYRKSPDMEESLREAEAWEDEPRNSKGEWTSGGDGSTAEERAKDRVERAKASAVRTGQHEQAIADRSEAVLSQAIGVPRTPNNQAFDLENDDVGIEVKTLVNGKNEKITMSKTALARKLGALDGRKGYTVVVDRRSGGLTGQATYYYREGFGSFRLGSMTKTTLSELRSIVKS